MHLVPFTSLLSHILYYLLKKTQNLGFIYTCTYIKLPKLGVEFTHETTFNGII